MRQVTYFSEKQHWASYITAPAASDMYAYGMFSSARQHWLEERQREIVQRWLEATSPSIPGIVSRACCPEQRREPASLLHLGAILCMGNDAMVSARVGKCDYNNRLIHAAEDAETLSAIYVILKR